MKLVDHIILLLLLNLIYTDIIDANENAPLITVNTLPTGGPQVSENSPPGTIVAHISVSDADSGADGEVICFISSDHFMLQKINSNEYKLVTATVFDREQRYNYAIRIYCIDNGEIPLSSAKTLLVKVLDVNDNAPIFTQDIYQVEVMENSIPGTVLYVLSAADRDENENGEIRYKMEVDAKQYLQLDEVT